MVLVASKIPGILSPGDDYSSTHPLDKCAMQLEFWLPPSLSNVETSVQLRARLAVRRAVSCGGR